MIELADIAYVRSGAADLATAVDFATRIVGLELVDGGEPGVAHLRADSRHHCLALVGGESGVIATGFSVADEDALALAEDRTGATGVHRHPRRCGGEPVAAGAAVHRARRPVRQPHRAGRRPAVNWGGPSRSPAGPGSPSSGTCASTRRTCARPTGSGPPRSTRRSRTGSATVPASCGSTRCTTSSPCSRTTNPACATSTSRSPRSTTSSATGTSSSTTGSRSRWVPGRHPQSTAVFLYFLGPEGFTYEYSFGVRRIEDDATWRPRMFDPEEPGSIDMWLGPKARTVSQPQLGRRLRVTTS